MITVPKWRALNLVGDWLCPPFVELLTSGSPATLDFTHARVPVPLIDLVLTGGRWGRVTLLIPDGYGVDTNEVTGPGTIRNDVASRPTRGMPRIVVRGRVTGGIFVRRPNARDQARSARLTAKTHHELER